MQKWIAWIEDGLLHSSPAPPGKMDAVQQRTFASIGQIPFSVLPRYTAERYLQDQLLRSQFFSADFIGFLNRFGKSKFIKLLSNIQLLKQAASIRMTHLLRSTGNLRQVAADAHISLATLYRKEVLFMASDLRKLVLDPAPGIARSHALCLLAQDYLAYHFLRPNAPSQNQLLRNLIDEAARLGTGACTRCPFQDASAARTKWDKRYPEHSLPACSTTGKGMIIPGTRYPVNRFLASIPRQDIAFGRSGAEVWTTLYAHKTVREKPETVNAVWFGDHHLADVVVIVGTDAKTQEPILSRPWITVVTDAASNAIIGSVVTLRPNSMTIAECFCRAAAFTIDSPFYGLPEVFYVDRGKDYRAAWLRGSDPDLRQRLDTDAFLNRAFSDNPMLTALNVTVHHALPRTGRSKTIERTFGTITRTWFSQLPGWTGNSPQKRPSDFEQEKKRLLKTSGLLTLEKFARQWFEFIVPAYNNASFEQPKSPVTLYQELPRANTLTPDWNSLAVFKAMRNKRYRVHSNGIHYKGDFYWHPSLRDYISQEVQIYDFDQSFCHSISVLFKGRFICEAEPLVRLRLIEADRLRLLQHLEEQKAAKRAVSRRVTTVQQVLQAAGVSTKRYAEPLPDEASGVSLPVYAEAVDLQRDKAEATILSDTASALGKAARQQLETVERIAHEPPSDPLTDYLLKIGTEKND